MLDVLVKGFKRRLARGALGLAFSAHFMRRRALAVLNRHFSKGELVLRYRLPDHTLYLDPADDVITARILLRGDWQRGDLERVIAILATHVPASRGGLFIDIGANIGSETVYAMLSGVFSQAVAIEPEPHNFALLEENLAANDLQSRVRAVNCAAGLREETRLLVRSAWNKGGHAIEGTEGGTEFRDAITVNVLPLPLILERAGLGEKRVGLVWIDVNGSEAAVLRGMGDMLARHVPIVIEHLPSLVSADTARDIHSLLLLHYKWFCRIDAAGGKPAPVSEMDPLRASGDFLFF